MRPWPHVVASFPSTSQEVSDSAMVRFSEVTQGHFGRLVAEQLDIVLVDLDSDICRHLEAARKFAVSRRRKE